MKTHVDYIFLVPGDSFSGAFVNSWSSTLDYLYTNNKTFMFHMTYTPIVSETRNYLFSTDFSVDSQYGVNSTALFDNRFTCDKIVMIDSDVIWTPQNIHDLLSSPYPVISGIYVLNGAVSTSVKKHGALSLLSIEDLKKEGLPFAIEGGGLGFTACSFEVISKLKYPWFGIEHRSEVLDGKLNQKTFGEDFHFFNKIVELGYTPMADPRIRVGHEKKHILRVG